MLRCLSSLIAIALLGSCADRGDQGVVEIAYLGDAATDAQREALTSEASLVKAAQQQGLVRFNDRGEVVPGLAERWIVTDDGRSYIFRISEFDLPDGTRITARSVASALNRILRQSRATSLGLDLQKVSDIRAMTGRVIEIRLRNPMPGFLSLLAQPELGIAFDGGQMGPMRARREEGVVVLDTIPPEERGLAQQADWDELVRAVHLQTLAPADAAKAFARGEVDVLLGGRMETLPLAITGALSRGTVRLDSAVGLFGLDVARPAGFLADAANREAIAMAIDRPALVQQFNLGGWSGSDRIVPAGLPGDEGVVAERWQGMTLEQRRASAVARVRGWAAEHGGPPGLSIYLPPGPGSAFLLQALARDLAGIGITATRAQTPQEADLKLRDSVARFPGARWFLNQFNCEISAPVCSPDADFLVQLSLDARDAAEEASFLAEAEQTLTATNLFIPLGSPIRWSQVRAGVEGFAENPYAWHPLFPFSRAPI